MTGPLDGQIMEIDSSAKFEEGILNEDVKIIIINEGQDNNTDFPETKFKDENQAGTKGENVVVSNGHNFDSVGFVVENEVLDENFKITEDSRGTMEDNLRYYDD